MELEAGSVGKLAIADDEIRSTLGDQLPCFGEGLRDDGFKTALAKMLRELPGGFGGCVHDEHVKRVRRGWLCAVVGAAMCVTMTMSMAMSVTVSVSVSMSRSMTRSMTIARRRALFIRRLLRRS